MKRIFVGMPSASGYPHPEVMFNLFHQELPEGCQLIFDVNSIVSGEMVQRARNELVRRFLDGRYDYLLWCDDDNPPSINALKYLIEADKDIVSGIVPLRGGHAYNVTVDGKGLKTLKGVDDIFEIENFGGGFCLLSRKVVKDIFEATHGYPYMFSPGDFVWNKELSCLELYSGQTDTEKYQSDENGVMIRHGELGEDLFFGIQAKKLGYKAYASKYALCKHLKRNNVFIMPNDIECQKLPS